MGAATPGGMSAPTETPEPIPVLDCSAGLENVASDLVFALKQHGFVYLVHHGISNLWIDTALSEADKFFTLPNQAKNKYKRKYTDFGNYRNFNELDSGYTAIKQDQIQKLHNPGAGINSDYLRECYDVVFQDGKYLFFPDEMTPNFRPAAIRILKSLSGLGMQVLRAIGTGLKLEDPDILYKAHRKLGHNGNVSALRFSHYPPIYDRRPILNYARTGENVSFGTIILVLQDSNEGLEGTDLKGNFRPIHPMRNAVLVTSGELLERWTDGKIWAPSARVQIAQDLARRSRRRNVAVYYLIPDNDVKVEPLRKTDDGPDPILVGEYMSQKLVQMNY